jgi:hypothetical protein
MKFMIAVLFTLASVQSSAGVGAHGGNVVLCKDGTSVTLDYYNAALPSINGPADIVDITNWSQQEVIDFFRMRLSGSIFLSLFDEASAFFGPLNSWPLATLIGVNDGGEPYFLPEACARVTAAVRQGNTIYLDPSVVGKLSEAQKGMLFVHEMLYWLSQKDSSISVREAIRILMQKNIIEKDIIKAVRFVGPYFGYEVFSNSQNPSYFPPANQDNLGFLRLDIRKKGPVSVGSFDFQFYFQMGTFFKSVDCTNSQDCEVSVGPEVKSEFAGSICKVRIFSLDRLTVECSKAGFKKSLVFYRG